MRYSRLLPLLVLAGCGEGQPTSPGGPAFGHTPGHKLVNSLADPGNGPCNASQCTLREAIDDPGSTEISFAPGLTGTITLASPTAGGGTLTIDKKLSITGPRTGIVIRRRSTDPAFRVFRIPEGGNATLTNVTIRGGKREGAGGGGIINFGTLRLSNCTVASNSASFGGGIGNHGTLTLTRSRVADNTGGGVSNRSAGRLALEHSTIAQNSGAGILNSGGGTLTLAHSTVSRNTGVGIASGGVPPSTATVTNARIVGNSGGGIASFRGSFTLTNSTVAGNSAFSGGGVSNTFNGSLTINKSTIVGNSATNEGGGIFNEGRVRFNAFVRLINSTVSGNSAPSGGGIFNGNRGEFSVGFSILNSTVVSNSATGEGGGIKVSGEAVLALTNSLVAQNSAPTGPDVLRLGSLAEIFAGFNLIGNGSGSGITNTNGNQVGDVPPNAGPIDPRLGPLADNGGRTRTHALLAGSLAIDAASTPDCPTTDQRGVPRPQGAACDIGSYERE